VPRLFFLSHGFVVLAMIQAELKVGSWDGLGFGLVMAMVIAQILVGLVVPLTGFVGFLSGRGLSQPWERLVAGGSWSCGLVTAAPLLVGWVVPKCSRSRGLVAVVAPLMVVAKLDSE